MKSKSLTHYIIAASVILCSAVLLTALAYAIGGFNLSSGGQSVRIYFKDATGVKLNTQVRYAGAPVGSVRSIRLLTREERAQENMEAYSVEVIAMLSEEVPEIKVDSLATLGAETMLGEKFVALTPGSLDAEPLPEQQPLLAEAGDPLAKLTAILTKVEQDYPSLISPVQSALTRLDGVVLQTSNLLSNLDRAVLDAGATLAGLKNDYSTQVSPKLESIMAQAEAATLRINSVVTNANQTVMKGGDLIADARGLIQSNTNEIHQILGELKVVSQNLKVASSYIKSLSATLGEKPSRLIWGRKEIELPSEQDILKSGEPVPLEPRE